MENERLLKFVNQEIEQRQTNKEINLIKRMSDSELYEFKLKLEKEKEEEYKKIGWLK